jgi:hypothetical protein
MELQLIQSKIYEIRGVKAILGFDLAEMYRVETKSLNLSVKRNMKRFPPDFMFQLIKEEWEHLRLQIETSKRGGRRYLPYAFTEQGVAMLSGLLNSNMAIEININIMRAFVAVRTYLNEYASTSKEITRIWEHVKSLEKISEENMKAINDLSEDVGHHFDDIYIALSELADRQQIIDKPRIPIGYTAPQYKDKTDPWPQPANITQLNIIQK